MSRWDSLKPRNKGPSRRSQESHRRSDSSTKNPRNASRVEFTQSSRTETSALDRSLKVLRAELLAKKNTNLPDSAFDSKIFSALSEIDNSILNSPLSGRSEVFVLFVDILSKNIPTFDNLLASVLEKLFSDKTQYLSATQARLGVSALSQKYLSHKNPAFLNPLALLVQGHFLVLPAEYTARSVIAGVSFSILGESSHPGARHAILDTVSALLGNPQHASALLGSLIQDVTKDGKEEFVANPLRWQLVRLLQNLLHATYEPSLRCASCEVLSKVIDVLNKMDSDCTFEATCLDLQVVERFITATFDERQYIFYRSSLGLLRSLSQHHPSATARLMSNLILAPNWNGRARYAACRYCHTPRCDLGGFMQCVHFESARQLAVDEHALKLAITCLAECVKSLPWKRYVSLQTAPFARSGLGRQVIDSLVIITDITICNFRRCDDACAEPLSELAKNLFLKVPFVEDRITEKAVDLLATLASIAFQRSCSPRINEVAFSTMIHSMGGWETPQGETIPMSLATDRWLSREESVRVVMAAFDAVKSNDNHSELSFQFLSALLRTRPQTAVERHTEFSEILNLGSRSDSTGNSFHVLGLAEAFMLGRKKVERQQGDSTLDSIALDILSALRVTRDDERVKCRCATFNIYAALLSRDWNNTELAGRHNLSDHFDFIIVHCQELNAKVRSAACKALGEFCAEYFSSREPTAAGNYDSFSQTLAQHVSDTMLKTVHDKNASVRSMAHLCIGNLAYAIRAAGFVALPIDESTLLQVCTTIQQALQDPNDKVGGNALRSIGNWGFLLSLHDSLDQRQEKTNTLRLILESIKAKLSAALSLFSGDRQALTWKKRSIAKKHGWGAANTTSLLFQCVKLDDDLDSQLCQAYFDALRLLVTCAEKSAELSEKITVSAMTAIRSLPTSQLSILAGRSGIIGEGIVMCVVRLYLAQEDTFQANNKLVEEYELLLRHLLASVTVLDASTVLRSDVVSRKMGRFLYTWMVANGIEGHSFQVFALAFQKPGLKATDVFLEQSFDGRARQQCKKGDTASDSDDDADEF